MARQASDIAGPRGDEIEILRQALALGVWSDPSLASVSSAQFDGAAVEILDACAAEISRQQGGEGGASRRSAAPQAPLFTEGLRRVALHELAIGTALVVQNETHGNLDVAAPAAHEASRRLFALAAQLGPLALVQVYWLHASYLNYRMLRHYGQAREEDFLSGRLHRPWCDYRLTEDLRLARRLGHAETVPHRPGMLRLTARGEAWITELDAACVASGVRRARDIQRESSVKNLSTAGPGGILRAMPGLQEGALQVSAVLQRIGKVERALELGATAGILLEWARAGVLDDATEIWFCGNAQGRLLHLRQTGSGRLQVRRCLPNGDLPFADGSFDLVVLPATAFRQWLEPILQQVRRALREGGHLVLLSSSGWPAALPRAVLGALPQPVAQDFFDRTEGVRTVQAAEEAGFTVLETRRGSLWGEVTSGEGLYALLGETGLLAEIERRLPCAAAEHCEDRIFDACTAALRSVKGAVPFELGREMLLARR